SGTLGPANGELYVAHRDSLDAPFGTPVPLSVDTGANEWNPWISPDELTLLFDSDRAGAGERIYVATRTTVASDFGAPAQLSYDTAEPGVDDSAPFVAGDRLWYGSLRAGGMGATDLYVASSSGVGFATATAITELNGANVEDAPTLSADLLTIYFASDRTGAGT